MADVEGPGVRADRASKKRLLIFQGIYALVAIALTVGLISGRRDPADGFPPFTPEAGIAGAILLPLLTLVTMWFSLRILDEVFRRIVVDAWAVTFVVTMLGGASWFFLVAGGVVPEPAARVVFLALLAGGGFTVVVAAVWLRWRRVGDLGAA